MTLMEGFISDSVSSYSEFLSENHPTLKNSNNIIISFAVSSPGYSHNNRIDPLIKLHERSFYFSKPAEKFSALGVNDVFTIAENGDRRFAATGKKIKEIKHKIITNKNKISLKDIPLFFGGMKFYVEHDDADWKDFNDSTWFIPEFLLIENNDENYIFNSDEIHNL